MKLNLLLLILLSACSMGTMKSGGDNPYLYNSSEAYDKEKLSELSREVVVVERRNPPVGTLEKLFSSKQPPLRRVAILVFESDIQGTRAGLAGSNLVYPSAQGKQLLTEKMLTIWEEGFGLLKDPSIEYVSTSEIKNSKAIAQYGIAVEDYIKSERSAIDPDDISYVEKGKSTPTQTVVNPRGMRDLSFLLVPASELMSGPKWSNHQKLLVNEISKELRLDAVIVINSDIQWTAAHQEKRSGEHIPEEMVVKLKVSTLVPFSSYHQRLINLKNSDKPGVNLCYSYHTGVLKVPVKLTVDKEEENFETVNRNILSPLITTYRDLTMMMITSLQTEWKKSYGDGK